MAIEIKWLGHASFRLAGSKTVYIDPWKIDGAPHDGDIVFISHSHHDHLSPEDVEKVIAPGGAIVASADVAGDVGGLGLAPGEQIDSGGVSLTGVWAYNADKDFHPRANDWLGVVVGLDGVNVYYAGDTDHIEEMADLEGIDVALLPVGGKYTMTAVEAARALVDIAPAAAVPYHFGDIVGSSDDARTFADAAGCPVHVLAPGQAVTVGD